ncbi:WD40-repeat-containing domain protein [Ilyonectria robusta]|uniref:WD40-repeat-containing domain protein n=1 Tax=Ilyonectria robusta TaxID=1079257 RepID=UPI001E8D805E|nr:WD40-repeat-containing domain protein [Ilyonectria robusta]KAH8733500.1 WD40-repeat-containing domain protein [Ilyonectria robusta]
MAASPVSVEYLSTGANRQTAVADWSRGGILAFGADINVALWRPASDPPKGVTKLLGGHKETVKAVTFLPEADGDTSSYLITGSDDKTIIVWKTSHNGEDFAPLQTSSEHVGAINCISVLRVKAESPKWIIATGAADASIKIWSFENDQLQLQQTLKTAPKYFPLALSLSYLGDEDDVFVLASAGTRDIVQILTAEAKADKIQFQVQATLSGHEGWIRCLSFTKETDQPGSDVLLASASQDKYVRIWRIHQGKELPALVVSGSDPLSDAYLPGKSPSNKAHRLNTAGKDFSVTFEALLLGHEDWIYSAHWCRQADGKLQLLSTSADNSLAIWEADPSSGIWISMVRLGEISREKGATTATGSIGGFWTGLWSPDGSSVACLGRTGSWRRWQYLASEDSWRPCIAITGHTRAVTGISWAKNGDYILSTSSDQTTRLHTRWKGPGTETWHEMSRPQIHGYDLNCIDSLGDSQFVSGADEKLMRVFSEPKAVASMLNRLAGIGGGVDVQSMPDAANMPVLGLSNKAIDAVDDDLEIQPVDDRDREAMDPASVVKKSHLELDHPPYEETLSRHTLWPETEKLYGHGYELSCLAASNDGKLVASACKASSTNHAVIRLFETERWTELRPPLTAHSLTATRLRFSADDQYLLSVGRDRQWVVFVRVPEEDAAYKLLQVNPKGHTRMILDAAWAPSTTPLFATAGRDKQVRVWASKASEDGKLQFTQTASIPCGAPVTSVDFLSQSVNSSFVLAVGTELGRLTLCLVKEDGSEVVEKPACAAFCLPKAVLQLAWRPVAREGAERAYEIAVAGEDTSLRVYAFSHGYLGGS